MNCFMNADQARAEVVARCNVRARANPTTLNCECEAVSAKNAV